MLFWARIYILLHGFGTSVMWKCSKIAKKSKYRLILNNFRTHYAFYGHLQHQKSTYMGPESPKSIHKFLLPENAFIIDFSDVEMPLRCPKVELRGQKPQNFNPKSVMKFWKVLLTLHFLVKICILVHVFVCCILKTSITAFIFDLLKILHFLLVLFYGVIWENMSP